MWELQPSEVLGTALHAGTSDASVALLFHVTSVTSGEAGSGQLANCSWLCPFQAGILTSAGDCELPNMVCLPA